MSSRNYSASQNRAVHKHRTQHNVQNQPENKQRHMPGPARRQVIEEEQRLTELKAEIPVRKHALKTIEAQPLANRAVEERFQEWKKDYERETEREHIERKALMNAEKQRKREERIDAKDDRQKRKTNQKLNRRENLLVKRLSADTGIDWRPLISDIRLHMRSCPACQAGGGIYGHFLHLIT